MTLAVPFKSHLDLINDSLPPAAGHAAAMKEEEVYVEEETEVWLGFQ